MSTGLLIALSVLEAVLLVVVLALALIRIRRQLTAVSEGLGTLGSALATVEAQHLRPLGKAVEDINAPLQTLVAVFPGIAAKAAAVRRSATGS